MKLKEPVECGQHDMFRSRLDQIIDMGHEKVVLAGAIDWQFCQISAARITPTGPATRRSLSG